MRTPPFLNCAIYQPIHELIKILPLFYLGIMEIYERHGVSNQYQLDYLFNSLFILTALETKKARIAGLLCLCADCRGFPAQMDSNVQMISKT